MKLCLNKDYKLERLDEKDDLSSFFCGVDSLDDCLHSDFWHQVRENKAVVYCVRSKNILIAIFSIGLNNLELDRDDVEDVNMSLEEPIQFEINPNGNVAVKSLEIYFLAVNEEFQHNGIGSVVIDTITEFLETKYNEIRFVSLDALKSAVGFYQKNGFNRAEFDIPNNPTLRMYKVL